MVRNLIIINPEKIKEKVKERNKEIDNTIPTVGQAVTPPPSMDPEVNPHIPEDPWGKVKFVIVQLLKLFGKDPGGN